MIRSVFEMKLDSVFSIVVLPEPVPPEIRTFKRALIEPSRSITISGVKALKFSRSSSLSGFEPKRRIETAAPSRAKGGIIAFTRDPSCNLASTIGQVSSTRRPTLGHNAIDNLHQVTVITKLNVRPLHLSLTFNEDVTRAVDQDVTDFWVLQQ